MYTKQETPPVLTWILHSLDFVAPAAYGEWRMRFLCFLLSPRLQESSTQKSVVTPNSTCPPGGHCQQPKRSPYSPITPVLVPPQPLINGPSSPLPGELESGQDGSRCLSPNLLWGGRPTQEGPLLSKSLHLALMLLSPKYVPSPLNLPTKPHAHSVHAPLPSRHPTLCWVPLHSHTCVFPTFSDWHSFSLLFTCLKPHQSSLGTGVPRGGSRLGTNKTTMP